MNFKPILFSTEMVKAILDGRKTMTRRVVKYPVKCPTHHISVGYSESQGPPAGWCPKWQVGDVLWVKETFWEYGRWVSSDDPKMKRGKEWHPLASEQILFDADNPKIEPAKGLEWSMRYEWRKMPSMFLDKTQPRIFLEIADIKVERVQEISEEDAMAEGIEDLPFGARGGFNALWKKINGPDSWNANCWVWVISFKRIDKPESFK